MKFKNIVIMTTIIIIIIIIIILKGCFDDEDVTHVDGDINPIRDLETISQELRLKDEQFVSQRIVRG